MRGVDEPRCRLHTPPRHAAVHRSAALASLLPALDHAGRMPAQHFNDVRDHPLTTDEQLVPFLQSMLEGSFRRQVWVMLLDHEARPLPVLIPMDVPAEPDPEEVDGFTDFFSCTSLEFGQATLVVTFERPGPLHVVAQDRRWLRFLREACARSGFGFRGPYLLAGNTVVPVRAEEYGSIPMVYSDDDGDDDQSFGGPP
jgi:hypothetical protein